MNRWNLPMRRALAALLLGLTIAGSAAVSVTSLPVCAEETASGYRYAVQLYGIHVDTLEGDVTGGLTFGPALGEDYTSSYVQHDPDGVTRSGHAHRCIHQDSWEQVIEYSYDDPYIYEQCLEKGCTKAVPLRLTKENASSSDKTRVFHTGKATQCPDGDGVGTLYYELWESARVYGIDGSGANSGRMCYDLSWANSQIRAVLNGEQSVAGLKFFTQNVYTYDAESGTGNSILAAFPQELREAIGKKAVDYASDMKPRKNQYAVVYDQLWILSNMELYGNADGSLESYHRDDQGPKVGYVGEGTQYQRTKAAGVRVDQENASIVAYKAAGSRQSYWTRSRYYEYGTDTTWTNEYCSAVFANGDITYSDMSYSTLGVSPCFTLKCDPQFTQPQDGGDGGDSGSGDDSGNAGDSGDAGDSGNAGNSGNAGDSGNTGDSGSTSTAGGSDSTSGAAASTVAAAADTSAMTDAAWTADQTAMTDTATADTATTDTTTTDTTAAAAAADVTGVATASNDGTGNAISATGDDSAMMIDLAIAAAAAILLVGWRARRY